MVLQNRTNKTYDVVVCTTAVDRVDLHKKVFPKYIEFLSELNIYWMFAMNDIWNTTDKSIQYLISILTQNNIDYNFSCHSFGGTNYDFYKSAHYLLNNVSNMNPKYGTVWLEDDWLLVNEDENLKYILESFNLGKFDYIGLTENNYMSFNPGVFGMGIVNKVMLENINNIQGSYYAPSIDDLKKGNPERASLYGSTQQPHSIECPGKHYRHSCFKDFGRNWVSKNKLKERTFKQNL